MKFGLAICAVVTSASLSFGQAVCRNAAPRSVEHIGSLTQYNLALSSYDGTTFNATALVPDGLKGTKGVIFSLSSIQTANQRVEAAPAEVELAKRGRAVIVVDRTLTWPELDKTVGKRQYVALCAQQWLAANASIDPENWLFIGPLADWPTFDQLTAVQDRGTLTYMSAHSIGGEGDLVSTTAVLKAGMTADLMDDITDLDQPSNLEAELQVNPRHPSQKR